MNEFSEKLQNLNKAFPILDKLAAYLNTNNNIKGQKIAWHCHLTDLTAVAAKTLLAKGSYLILSECNPATTSAAAVNYMQECGATIYLGKEARQKSLSHKPLIISDTGLSLISEYINGKENFVFAANEITTSGITKLRDLKNPPLPVININAGQLKATIENFHGVGDGVIDALNILNQRSWSKQKSSVIGYGQVGAGVAQYLKKICGQVSIVEKNPIRALLAHYDGFEISTFDNALGSSDLLITATGICPVISGSSWLHAKDGLFIMNVGHLNGELDLDSLTKLSSSISQHSQYLQEFTLENKKIYIACEGNPANVVLLSGSPEPTLIHLTTEALCMNYLLKLHLAGEVLPYGENQLPVEIEKISSRLALEALGFQLN